MENKELTPMQELLKEIVQCRNIETDLLLPFIKNKIISKLPKEREQIEAGYNQGHFDGNSMAQVMNRNIKTYKSAQEYFTTKYKQ